MKNKAWQIQEGEYYMVIERDSRRYVIIECSKRIGAEEMFKHKRTHSLITATN